MIPKFSLKSAIAYYLHHLMQIPYIIFIYGPTYIPEIVVSVAFLALAAGSIYLYCIGKLLEYIQFGAMFTICLVVMSALLLLSIMLLKFLHEKIYRPIFLWTCKESRSHMHRVEGWDLPEEEVRHE